MVREQNRNRRDQRRREGHRCGVEKEEGLWKVARENLEREDAILWNNEDIPEGENDNRLATVAEIAAVLAGGAFRFKV